MRILTGTLAALALAAPVPGETVKDREGAVRRDRAALTDDGRWMYNDIPGAFAKARETGRPVMIVLRCVPCVSCMDIDARVLAPDSGLGPLLDQFVCARVINANDLDLSLFQFDYDVSFAVLFFNADRTIYGRFGTRSQRDARAADVTLEGFRSAIEGALELHRAFPDNRPSLTGKQGRPLPFRSTRDLPGLERYKAELDWKGNVVASCVHCHQVRDAQREWHRAQSHLLPEEIVYVSPLPQTIGMALDPHHRARVDSITEGSPAATAGIRPGDDVVSILGQPILSVADVQWALANAPAEGSLPVGIRRGGADHALTVALPAGWRRRADISWRATTWPLRAMATGGLLLEDLGDAERRDREVASDSLALAVKHVGQYGIHAAAKKAGFQPNDVIVEIDGQSTRATESEMIGRLLDSHRAGEHAETRVLRDGKSISLRLPIQ